MGRRSTDRDIGELKRMLQQYLAPKIAELTDPTVGGVTRQLKLSPRLRREGAADLGSVDPGPAGFDW